MASIACLGDSVTLGLVSGGGSMATPYPAKIALDTGHTVTNFGVGGNTTAQMLARMRTDILGRGFGVLTIMGGINDQWGSTPVATTEANFTAMISEARAGGMAVVISTVTPWNGYPTHAAMMELMTPLNIWIRAQTGVVVAECYSSALNAADYLAATYDSGDGIHPNQAGANLIASIFEPAIATALASMVSLSVPSANAALAATAPDLQMSGWQIPPLTITQGSAATWKVYAGETVQFRAVPLKHYR